MLKVMNGNVPVCEDGPCANYRYKAKGKAKCTKGGIHDMMPVKCGEWIKQSDAIDCADF